MILRSWNIFVICILFNRFSKTEADYESTGTINHLVVAIDREFRGLNYNNFLRHVQLFLKDRTQHHLTNGELSYEFYTGTDITIQADTTAMLSILSCDDTWKIYRRFKDNHLLHLAITEADCPRLPGNEGVTVPLVAPDHAMPQLMLDIKMSQLAAWTTSSVLYDDSVDTEIVQRTIKSLSVPTPGREGLAASVTVFRLEGTRTVLERRNSVLKVLKNFPVNRLGSNFVVVVSRELIAVVMEVCQAVGLSLPESQWLYLISDSDFLNNNVSAFATLLSEGENIAFAHDSSSSDEGCEGGLMCHVEELLSSFIVALDAVVQDEEITIAQVSPEEWDTIRPSKYVRRSTLLDILTSALTKGRCDLCTTWTLEAGDTWGLEYQEQEDQDSGHTVARQLVPVGQWSPRGLKMLDHLFPHIGHGFAGRNLPILSFNDTPWQIIIYNETSRTTEYKGLIFKIINQLAQNLNFRYTVMFPSKNKDGWTNDTTLMKDSFDNVTSVFLQTDRIIEILHKKRVFLAAGAFTVTPNRKALVNFTMPISIQTTTFLTARPGEVSRVFIFMAPFTYDTWACIVVLVVLVTPTLNYFHRNSPYYEYFYRNNIKGGLNSLFNCLWYVYGALMQQGGMHLPEADSGRILVGSWWLVVLVIVTSYGGNLVAFLTFPKYEDAVANLEDLLARRDTVSWGILKDTATEQHLKISPVKIRDHRVSACTASCEVLSEILRYMIQTEETAGTEQNK